MALAASSAWGACACRSTVIRSRSIALNRRTS